MLGIVVGVMGCLTLVLWLIKKREGHSENNESAEVVASGSTDTAGGGDIEGGVRASGNEPSSSTAVQAATSRRKSKSEPDDETQLGSRSLLSIQDTKGDEMSYAYSLDAGGTSTAGSTGLVATKGSLGDDFDSLEQDDEARQHCVTRQIVAPPGKLGLILDTILGKGPVVHKINSNSPLKGNIFEGDVIISINGIDTRRMNAEEITEIMVKTVRAQRILIIQSDVYNQ